MTTPDITYLQKLYEVRRNDLRECERQLTVAHRIIAEQTRHIASLYAALDPAKQSQFLIGALLRDEREAKR
jgi:hypothetical protein